MEVKYEEDYFLTHNHVKVMIVVVAFFVPPFLRFNSYSHFLDKMDTVENLKVDNSFIDPAQSQMVS